MPNQDFMVAHPLSERVRRVAASRVIIKEREKEVVDFIISYGVKLFR
jgi:hypothetical protein